MITQHQNLSLSAINQTGETLVRHFTDNCWQIFSGKAFNKYILPCICPIKRVIVPLKSSSFAVSYTL